MKEMKFEVISKEKNEVVFEVINPDRTLLIPLVEELNHDDMVEIATYHMEHPYMGKPILKVRVKSGKPQAAVKRAAKRLEKIFEEMEKEFEKVK